MAVDRIEARRRLIMKKRAGMDEVKARRMVARELGCEPEELKVINYGLLVSSMYERETSSGTPPE